MALGHPAQVTEGIPRRDIIPYNYSRYTYLQLPAHLRFQPFIASCILANCCDSLSHEFILIASAYCICMIPRHFTCLLTLRFIPFTPFRFHAAPYNFTYYCLGACTVQLSALVFNTSTSELVYLLITVLTVTL